MREELEELGKEILKSYDLEKTVVCCYSPDEVGKSDRKIFIDSRKGFYALDVWGSSCSFAFSPEIVKKIIKGFGRIVKESEKSLQTIRKIKEVIMNTR